MSSRKDDPWKDFRDKLDSFESNIKHLKYKGAFDAPEPAWQYRFAFRDIGKNNISVDQIPSILSPESVCPPHGLDLLKPVPVPQLPQFPAGQSELLGHRVKNSVSQPSTVTFWGLLTKGKPRSEPRPESQSQLLEMAAKFEREMHIRILERAEKLQCKLHELRQQFAQQFLTEGERLTELLRGCLENDIDAIRSLMKMTHVRHPLPTPLHKSLEFDLDRSGRIALCTVEIPDFAVLGIVRKRGDSWKAKELSLNLGDGKGQAAAA
jgi:hypothetical protein